MKLNIYRRNFLLKTTAVSAVVVFPSILIAKKVDAPQKTIEAITHTVEIQQFKFVPEQLEIRPGDSILWVNKDIVPHTATATDNSWDTGEILFNESKTVLFSKESKSTTTEYYCYYHPGMKAKINILIKD